jgi:transcriptional regulator with XRE-family HTH domain
MTGQQLRSGRESRGWGQEQAANRLGVSQPYLSLLEKGERRLPEKLAHKATRVYRLSATALPMQMTHDNVQPSDENALASELAALGYPGLSHLKRGRKRNPAELLLSALSSANLDSRLTEALPWLLVKHPELDWQWLVRAAKLHDLQNRLGFVTNVARRLAERFEDADTASLLHEREVSLERSRLMREDTLCRDSLTATERRWLKTRRSKEAKHWRLLTDLLPEHLISVS